MNVLIVTQYFWPESFRINDLAQSLLSRGYAVTVLTGMPTYPNRNNFKGYGAFFPAEENYQGVKVLRVPLCSRGKGSNIRLVINYLSFVISAGLLAPFRCRDRYDVIFVFQPSPLTSVLPAILLRKLRKTPLLLWVQDLWPETLKATNVIKSPALLKWAGKLVEFIYKQCDRVLVPCQGAVTAVESQGFAKEKIHYFPNWAENLYQPLPPTDNAPDALGIPRGFCVMFAGNIGVSQSFETILTAAQALESYADIHFVILGDGRQFDWLKEQVNQRKLSRFHLLGRKPVEQMPEFFAVADALLLTLKQDPIFALTIPSKLQSYLACGRPVIGAIDGEGAKVIQESGAGFVGPAEDANSLADNILRLYHLSSTQRQELGNNGRQYYTLHFEREKLLDNLETWMKSVVKENLP